MASLKKILVGSLFVFSVFSSSYLIFKGFDYYFNYCFQLNNPKQENFIVESETTGLFSHYEFVRDTFSTKPSMIRKVTPFKEYDYHDPDLDGRVEYYEISNKIFSPIISQKNKFYDRDFNENDSLWDKLDSTFQELKKLKQ